MMLLQAQLVTNTQVGTSEKQFRSYLGWKIYNGETGSIPVQLSPIDQKRFQVAKWWDKTKQEELEKLSMS